MPWIDNVERMLAFGKARASRRTELFFEALLIDPVETLSAYRPNRIIFARPGSEDDSEGEDDRDDGPLDIGPLDPDRDTLFSVKLVSERADGRVVPPLGTRSHHGTTEVIITDEHSALYVSTGASGFIWHFKPYVRRVNPVLITDFEREAERLLKWPWRSFRNRVKDKTTRIDLVSDAAKSRALAKAYKATFKNRNLTSLCLYSGPHIPSHGPLGTLFELCPNGCRKANKIGWLGTGDLPLASPRDAQAFLDHFRLQQGAVATFGLPHHGAKPNHSLHVFSLFQPTICHAAAKPPKNWKHPHPDVFTDVRSIGARPVHVSDQNASTLKEAYLVLV